MSEAKYNTASVGEQIRAFLERILRAAGLDVTFELADGEEAKAYFEQPSLVVKFGGRDVEYLMSNKGEGLLALEQLTQEMLRMSSDEHAHICFDANETRLMRMEELRLTALTIAERVKQTNTPYRFNPMSSRERRIIHLALREEKTLRSESSGSGPGRHVVLYPIDMPSLPEPPPDFYRRPAGPGSHGGEHRGDRRGSGGGGPRRHDGPPRRPRR